MTFTPDDNIHKAVNLANSKFSMLPLDGIVNDDAMYQNHGDFWTFANTYELSAV